MLWTIQQLNPSHDIAAFDCSQPSLDSFLRKNALNNDRAGLGRTFVAVEPGLIRVAGYFTISTGSVRRLGETLLVESLRKAAAASASVGIYAVDVFALHDKAKQFYVKYGFVEMLNETLHLFLPIETARQLPAAIDS